MAAQVQGGPGQLHRQHLHMYQKDLESQDSLHFHKKILSSLQHAVENYNVESAAYALVQGFLEGRLSCYMPTGNRVLYSIFQPHIDRVPGDPNMLVVNSYRIPDHGVYAGYPAHVDQHIYPHPEPIPIHFVEVKPLKYQNSWHAEMAVELAAKTALETIPQVNEQAQYLLDAHPNEDTIKIVIWVGIYFSLMSWSRNMRQLHLNGPGTRDCCRLGLVPFDAEGAIEIVRQDPKLIIPEILFWNEKVMQIDNNRYVIRQQLNRAFEDCYDDVDLDDFFFYPSVFRNVEDNEGLASIDQIDSAIRNLNDKVTHEQDGMAAMGGLGDSSAESSHGDSSASYVASSDTERSE